MAWLPFVAAVAADPAAATLPAIFNGHDLAGWKVEGASCRTVVDGVKVEFRDVRARRLH